MQYFFVHYVSLLFRADTTGLLNHKTIRSEVIFVSDDDFFMNYGMIFQILGGRVPELAMQQMIDPVSECLLKPRVSRLPRGTLVPQSNF